MLVVYRSSEWDTPWWAEPNRGEGRFNEVNSPPTQYWATHPLTPFAERLRGLGRDVAADLETIRWRAWAAKIDDDDLVEIGFGDATAHGIEPDDLVGDDWTPCQELARRLRASDVTGAVVPSAALPGTRCVVMFGERFASPYLLEPIDPGFDVPTAAAAERATPPSALVPHVRWHGEPHLELESWRHGGEFAFRDPAGTRP